jgi:hypothetical protein
MADEPALGGDAGPNALAIGLATNFLVPDLFGTVSRGNSSEDSSGSINAALSEADTILGSGIYYVSNPVVIQSGRTLFLTAGATLQAASDYAGNVIESPSYGTVGECDTAVAVAGFGTIVGGGATNSPPATAYLTLVSGTTLTLSDVPSSWPSSGYVWVADVLVNYTGATTGTGGTLTGCFRVDGESLSALPIHGWVREFNTQGHAIAMQSARVYVGENLFVQQACGSSLYIQGGGPNASSTPVGHDIALSRSTSPGRFHIELGPEVTDGRIRHASVLSGAPGYAGILISGGDWQIDNYHIVAPATVGSAAIWVASGGSITIGRLVVDTLISTAFVIDATGVWATGVPRDVTINEVKFTNASDLFTTPLSPLVLFKGPMGTTLYGGGLDKVSVPQGYTYGIQNGPLTSVTAPGGLSLPAGTIFGVGLWPTDFDPSGGSVEVSNGVSLQTVTYQGIAAGTAVTDSAQSPTGGSAWVLNVSVNSEAFGGGFQSSGVLCVCLASGIVEVAYSTMYSQRKDSGCSWSTTTSTITDPSIVSTDKGRLVSGTGIPVPAYVGTVGTGSFTLVNASGSPITPTANETSATLTVSAAFEVASWPGSGSTSIPENTIVSQTALLECSGGTGTVSDGAPISMPSWAEGVVDGWTLGQLSIPGLLAPAFPQSSDTIYQVLQLPLAPTPATGSNPTWTGTAWEAELPPAPGGDLSGTSISDAVVDQSSTTSFGVVNGLNIGVTSKNTSYTAADTDLFIAATASGITITLPSSPVAGQVLIVTNTSSGTVTVAAATGQTIGNSGATSVTLAPGAVIGVRYNTGIELWRYVLPPILSLGGAGLATLGGALTTLNSSGSTRNTLDDGSGNMTVAGDLTIDGTVLPQPWTFFNRTSGGTHTVGIGEWSIANPPGSGQTLDLPASPVAGQQPNRIEVLGTNTHDITVSGNGNDIILNGTASGTISMSPGQIFDFTWDNVNSYWRATSVSPP